MDNQQKAADPILLTGAGGFLGKYILRQLGVEFGTHSSAVVTLGLRPENDIVVDLTTCKPNHGKKFSTVFHCAGSCFGDNLETVNVTATANLLTSLEATPPENIVFFSTVDVYGRTEGSDYTEGTIPDPVSSAGVTKLEAETMLTQWCEARNVTLTILRCAPIVGTGMQGPLRRMVNSIYRGTFNHIEGNEARLSVVHAVDVARAAVELAQTGGIYNLTDGVNPTRHDLAEAFSARMDHKRVYTISRKRARRLARLCDFIPFVPFGTKQLKLIDTTLTFSSEKIISRLGWQPHSVTDYLTTHNYDENSL